MVANLRETETKYDAPAHAALPGLDQLPRVAEVRGPEEQQLEAEYYDTDDLRLIRAGITLRRRSGGSGSCSTMRANRSPRSPPTTYPRRLWAPLRHCPAGRRSRWS